MIHGKVLVLYRGRKKTRSQSNVKKKKSLIGFADSLVSIFRPACL